MSSPCEQAVPMADNNDPIPIAEYYAGADWVDSDDPESIRQYSSRDNNDNNNKPEGTSAKPGVGCWNGCVRDGHCKHAVLYLAIWVYIVAWIVMRHKELSTNCKDNDDQQSWFEYADNDDDDDDDGDDYRCSPFWATGKACIPFLVLYALFLCEFKCSSTNQYLRHTETVPAALQVLDHLYQTKPTLTLSMECYHYETRRRKDKDGKTYTERVKKVTWRGKEHVIIVEWEDVTRPRLSQAMLAEFQLTKVKIDKAFTADDNYHATKEAFVDRNRHRDKHYNLYVDYQVPGLQPRLLTYSTAFDAVPWLVGWDVLVLCHWLVLPALPYRLWLSSATGKVETVIHKQLQTAASA